MQRRDFIKLTVLAVAAPTAVKAAEAKPLRTVEIVDGPPHRIPFAEVKKGDFYRLYESDGEQVVDGIYNVFYAHSDAYYDPKFGTHVVESSEHAYIETQDGLGWTVICEQCPEPKAAK